MGCHSSKESGNVVADGGGGVVGNGSSEVKSAQSGTTAIHVQPTTTSTEGDSNPSVTIKTAVIPDAPSHSPTPQTANPSSDMLSSENLLPLQSPENRKQTSTSLMLPSDPNADPTASSKKRSSMRTAGQGKRDIPPKSGFVPRGRAVSTPIDADKFQHLSNTNAGANAHGGHHGYGPGRMVSTVDPADADASTQKNSDTGATSAADPMGSPGGPTAHHAGLHSGKRKKLARQTSHKGLLSKLALQFPIIKNSFEKVHEVFQRYHQQRIQSMLLTPKSSNASAAATPAPPTTNKVTDATGTGEAASGATFVSPETAVANASSAAAKSPAATSSSNPTATTSVTEFGSNRARKLAQEYMSEEISLDKLHEVLQHISGKSKTWTHEEVCTLFKLADLDGNKTISFREFLIAVSVGYFLKDENSLVTEDDPVPASAMAAAALGMPAPVSNSRPVSREAGSATAAAAAAGAGAADLPTLDTPSQPMRRIASESVGDSFYEIQRGFKMVENAFNAIDEDKSGGVDVNEMKRALFATTTKVQDQSILESRFAELDFDHSGDISFPEFMYGLYGWIVNDEEA